jgi:hypothetical protein
MRATSWFCFSKSEDWEAVAGDLELSRSFWRRLKAQGLGATAIAKALGIGRAIAY